MGFSTTINPYSNREVITCDNCGKYPAPKRRCPYGYCPSSHICKSCWDQVKVGRKERHASCKIASAEFDQSAKQEALMLLEGKFICRSALQHENENENKRVKVIFYGLDGASKAYFMAHSTYDAIKLQSHATPEDYAKIGAIIRANNCDIYDNEQGPGNSEAKPVITKEVDMDTMLQHVLLHNAGF